MRIVVWLAVSMGLALSFACSGAGSSAPGGASSEVSGNTPSATITLKGSARR